MNSGIAPGHLPKKYCGEPTPEIEVEFLDPGDLIRFWDDRSGMNRFGIIKSIGPKFLQVIVAKKVRKVRRDSEGIELITDKQRYKVAGNR
jgi:hypothetical protein